MSQSGVVGTREKHERKEFIHASKQTSIYKYPWMDKDEGEERAAACMSYNKKIANVNYNKKKLLKFTSIYTIPYKYYTAWHHDMLYWHRYKEL